MKLGIVIHSSDPETVWNAWRLAVFARNAGDRVCVFLLGKGVESEHLGNTQFDIRAQMEAFAAAGGEVHACGSCLALRHAEPGGLCPVGSLEDLHGLLASSDKVLSF